MRTLKRLIPQLIKTKYWKSLRDKDLLREFDVASVKHARELDYWRSHFETEGVAYERISVYKRLFPAIAGEDDVSFCDGKIVADFGCGPLGSLEWLTGSRLNICIDVLADAYARFGIAKHKACYVVSTETTIPLPSNYVDVLFTLNALDHVDNLPAICREFLRILAPGGSLIGCFNLFERRTTCEPQMLTAEKLDQQLFRFLNVRSRRLIPAGDEDRYEFCFNGSAEDPNLSNGDQSRPMLLWVRAVKPA